AKAAPDGAGEISLVAERGEFLAIGRQRGARAVVGAVEPNNPVIAAGFQRSVGIFSRLVVQPDPDAFEPHDGRLVVLRERDPDAAALAIDAAAEPHLVAFPGEHRVVAGAAGVEIAAAVAIA